MNVPIGKFKAAMSRYIRAANAGKDVVVTSRGKAVVRLVPVVEARSDKRLEESKHIRSGASMRFTSLVPRLCAAFSDPSLSRVLIPISPAPQPHGA